jgi:hypothetical protein
MVGARRDRSGATGPYRGQRAWRKTASSQSGSRAHGPLVLADDDVVFRRGNVAALVAYCDRAGFGLAQPAHTADSQVSHAITRARRLSVARLTTFVECGPLVVVSERWLERVLPLPETRGMGWGLELDWMVLREDGCPFGIVDSCRIDHVGVVGGGYDKGEAVRQVHAELATRGIHDWSEIQQTIAVWRPWRRSPPWPVAGRS